MILFDDPSVKVEYDDSVPSVIWTPVGSIFGDLFKQPFVIGMDFFEKQVKKEPNLGWLNDVRKLRTVKTEDINWLNENVNDRAYLAGGKKVAFVLPEDVFGKLGIRLYAHFTSRRPDNKLEIKAFNTILEAKKWLKGVESAKLNEVRLA
jgi:hypothetical protein